MKHFKTISTAFIIVIAVIFGCNVYYLVNLYSSIHSNVEREVMTAMADADIDDMWERAERANRRASTTDRQTAEESGEDSRTEQSGQVSGVVDPDNNFVTTTTQTDGSSEVNKKALRRDRSYSNQMVNEMSRQMHQAMDPFVEFNLMLMDSILMERLADRHITPDFLAVEIVDSTGKVLHCNPHVPKSPSGYDVFTLCFNPDTDLHYRAYMSPLTQHIFSEMAGVTATVFLLMLAFAMAFVYLFRTVSRLRTIEEMKDDFVSNMTHELKTPIAIAYSANDALLNYDAENNAAKRTEYLVIANKQLKRLGELVENILAIGMERRKAMRLKNETVLLKPFIDDIAAAQRMRIDKDMDIMVTGQEGIAVEADKTHLANILNNLIDNAIKYSGEKVSISISADACGISVADNGIGIPPKALPYLFNKFYRVPHGNRHDVRGYGIGLYYVKSILDKMGWSIGVRSREGEGSVFTVRFTNDEK